MNNNIVKVLVPVVAILIIVESIVLLGKYNKPKAELIDNQQNDVVEEMSKNEIPKGNEALTFSFDNVQLQNAKVGGSSDVNLMLTSTKDIAIDALDLYVSYNPSLVNVSSVNKGDKFVSPSFKKVSVDKKLVVMNFMVSEPSGYILKAGEVLVVAKLKVNFTFEGNAEFNLGEGTLVVENGSAKVLPFNSNKLVINVSR